MTYINQHAYKPIDAEVSTRQLNSLLRKELAAAETYRMAIDKVRPDGDAASAESVAMLRAIESEHAQAAEKLRERIRAAGAEPAQSPGDWDTYAVLVRGATNLLADTAALRGLRMGEEHGLKDYRQALDEVDEASRQLIQQRLIPAERQHIAALDRLMTVTGRG